MATWNSRGLRGSGLEDLINRTNESYREKGLALIQKVPTPITPIKIDKENRHITLAYFDQKLPEIIAGLGENDILMITADHGCDPGYIQSTDHSREYTPLLVYGKNVEPKNLGTRDTFADIGATVLKYFDIEPAFAGESLL